jgi:hypothetical protein
MKLPPYQAPFDPEELEEESFVWSAGERALARPVPSEYGWGERAFVALDCELPGIGCPVRLVAARVTVP